LREPIASLALAKEHTANRSVKKDTAASYDGERALAERSTPRETWTSPTFRIDGSNP
jgi:hypothetical protein